MMLKPLDPKDPEALKTILGLFPGMREVIKRYPERTCRDVVMEVAAGVSQLWVDGDTFAVTQIASYPRRTVCVIVMAGGDLDVIQRHLPAIEHWAYHNGCDEVEIIGRRGWVRVFSESGYKETATIISKELSDG